jgi:ferric-dicitrate binding protein FerR (iron transport regulator)
LKFIQRRPEIEARVLGAQQSDRDAAIVARRLYPESTTRRAVLRKQVLRRGMWPSVAALVMAVLVTVISWNAGVSHVTQKMARSTIVYTTANGQRANITMPDGSTVMLNVASRLEVPADYGTGHHTVRLVGEGLFTILRHTGMPFTVLAGSATVRVLGTSFLVRRYTTDSMTTVAVRDGKVAVRSVVLAAAQQVAVGPTGVGRVQSVDPTQFGFATGVLTLNGMLFPNAIAVLDRWYDADIRLGDPVLARRRVAGEYAVGSLEELSDILAGTFNVRVVRNGRVLTLFPR